MLSVMSGISKTQEDIRKLEEFMVEAKKSDGSMSAVNQAVRRLEILLHTGIDLALVAAVVMRQGKAMEQRKQMQIKLVVET